MIACEDELSCRKLAAIVVPCESSRRKKTVLSSKKRALLNKITHSGMLGDNTKGLPSTGKIKAADRSSAIRRNYIIIESYCIDCN